MRTPILLASALVLWQPAATAQPAQGPLAIKLFQFVLGSQIHQSGASFEVLNGSAGDLELGVFSTTGQSIAGMSWRIATADGRFDSGAQIGTVVAGPAYSLLKYRWTIADGTHRFIGWQWQAGRRCDGGTGPKCGTDPDGANDHRSDPVTCRHRAPWVPWR